MGDEVRVGRIYCPHCSSDNGKVLSTGRAEAFRCKTCLDYVPPWDAIIKWQPKERPAVERSKNEFKKFRGYNSYKNH